MTIFKQALILAAFSSLAACSKTRECQDRVSGDTVVQTGNLRQQGVTTYQYGTHVLDAVSGSEYVVKSETIDLDKYVGKHVQVTAINMHYTVENGPELYNVISVVEK